MSVDEMMQEERTIAMLVVDNGKAPVRVWLENIRDTVTRARIARQIEKLARGLGTQKNLKEVTELKIDLGPGYRVYYALLDQKTLVVLICGGDKSTQSKDIANARRLWNDFQSAGAPETFLRPWREPAPEATQIQEPDDPATQEKDAKEQ